MTTCQERIPRDWRLALAGILDRPKTRDLFDIVEELYSCSDRILPAKQDVFKALHLTRWDDLRIVLLGQDPYHKVGQAMGLSFSVPKGVRIPPSLRNIYRELYEDVGCLPALHGDLTSWADQGVLLLNSILTVREGAAASHAKLGWETFTDGVIRTISDYHTGIVFLLWGNYAKKKADLIDQTKHHVIGAAHPSPLARGAFFGSKPFSQANALLLKQSKTAIQWQLP